MGELPPAHCQKSWPSPAPFVHMTLSTEVPVPQTLKLDPSVAPEPEAQNPALFFAVSSIISGRMYFMGMRLLYE